MASLRESERKRAWASSRSTDWTPRRQSARAQAQVDSREVARMSTANLSRHSASCRCAWASMKADAYSGRVARGEE